MSASRPKPRVQLRRGYMIEFFKSLVTAHKVISANDAKKILNYIITTIDVNGDGNVSVGELVILIKRLSKYV